MTRLKLIARSAAFHWRSNLGALLAAAAGCAVLVGALIVGDSVRYTLRTMAVERLGAIDTVLLGQDRFFKDDLGRRVTEASKGAISGEPLLLLPGVCASDANQLRANDVQICGVAPEFWKLDESPFRQELLDKTANFARGETVINAKLAELLQAKAGDTIRVRLYKPGILPHDAPLGAREDQAAFLRVKIKAIVPARGLGRFSLQGNQTTPANLFVPLLDVQEQVEQAGRANVLLFTADKSIDPNATQVFTIRPPTPLQTAWSLDDAQLKLRHETALGFTELSTPRVFLDDTFAEQLHSGAAGLTTYFVNAIRANGKEIPYSMVTAAAPPLVDPGVKDDEIVLNQWAAEDLGAKPGDAVELEFFTVGLLRKLETKKAAFTVKAVVPIEGLQADKGLLPDFPGIAEVDSTHDWKAGIPIDMKKIRQKDEDYWKKYRGTPKAFITLKRGTELWKNRFGTYTALRFPLTKPENLQTFTNSILIHARPERLGMPVLAVKAQALAGAEQSMDFGGLFLGLSFFLIGAALLLMALIFQFGVESRARETGVLLALGFPARSVRFLLWGEGLAAAALGAPLGALGGMLYARLLINSLSTRWQGAVGGTALEFHATPLSIAIGCIGAIAAAGAAIFFAVRKQAQRPARELLSARGSEVPSVPKKFTAWKIAGAVGLAGSVALIALGFKSGGEAAAGLFFGSGALLLIFALAVVRSLLAETETGKGKGKREKEKADVGPQLSLAGLGLRGARRRPGRSLATVALLASGAFLVSAVGVNELDAAAGAKNKTSGTGGYALFARSTIPIFDDLNTRQGRDKAGVRDEGLEHAAIFPMRVKSGDEASCLNLNRAQRPRILGVPDSFIQRGGFTFSKLLPGFEDKENPWNILHKNLAPGDPKAPIPAVCDQQSMQWALHLGIGDELSVEDEHGTAHKLKLAGAVSNSILQGNILIAEEHFLRLFPSESGYRYFFIDAPDAEAPKIATVLADALSDSGFEAQTAVSRLMEFNAVQNTYLATFQALGGLGMLLGTLGLGVIVLRNMLERRAELAMLRAIGFSRSDVGLMIGAEHTWLLLLGLCAGVFAALAAIAPTLTSAADLLKWRTMNWMLLGILTSGLGSMLLATWSALRSPLLDALKSE